jgi:hypothetical protein
MKGRPAGTGEPASPFRVATAGNAKWLAYEGASAEAAVSFLTSEGYEKVPDSGREMVFLREFHGDPHGPGFFAPRIAPVVEWQLRDKVIIRLLTSDDDQRIVNPLVVLGIAAELTRHVSKTEGLLGSPEENVDLHESLCDRMLSEVALLTAVSTSSLKFVDASLWAKAIQLQPWGSTRGTPRHMRNLLVRMLE